MSFQTNIISATEENTNFRTVLFTGEKSQLVVMNIPAGGEIGEETHSQVEQTFHIVSGEATVVMDGEESAIGEGYVVVVSPGTTHNFINRGSGDLKLYTVYAPPNHIDKRVHESKEAADEDTEDEAFGEAVK